jgi:hypothetical protein
MVYVYSRKNFKLRRFFRSNWIRDLGDINWGKYFAVRQNKSARQREKNCPAPVGANGSPSVLTWVTNVWKKSLPCAIKTHDKLKGLPCVKNNIRQTVVYRAFFLPCALYKTHVKSVFSGGAWKEDKRDNLLCYSFTDYYVLTFVDFHLKLTCYAANQWIFRLKAI